MKTSTDRILTTHVGSLARPDRAARHDEGEGARSAVRPRPVRQQVRDAVADRVRKQVENGIDIVTDGEMSKVSFIGYVKDRLGGFEVEEGGSGPAPSWQVEIDMFPEYYADYMGKYSAAVAPLRRIIARGPVSYVGHDLLKIDIDNLKAAVAAVETTATRSPTSSCRRPARAGSAATSTTRRTPSTSRPSARRCARSTWRSSTPASSCRSTTRG